MKVYGLLNIVLEDFSLQILVETRTKVLELVPDWVCKVIIDFHFVEILPKGLVDRFLKRNVNSVLHRHQWRYGQVLEKFGVGKRGRLRDRVRCRYVVGGLRFSSAIPEYFELVF